MTEIGHSVQVVTLEDGQYKLNEEKLQQILLINDIKDLPVVVVSVAGAIRGGKSFLLNFFLRYLSSPPSAREDGSWIGDENEELQGFSWRGGLDRNTTGVLMWSQPFIMRSSSGSKVAILLMDTQGNYDSTIRECSTIFTLSTLLSSVQIYNLTSIIKENDLLDLELLTDYGKLFQEQSGSKAFQVLEFLIRDWMNDEEYAYGEVGGQAYLRNKLNTTDKQPKELQKLRKHILDSFDKVKCFLMPHPGLKVGKRKFKGKLSEIPDEFKDALKELTSSIFSKKNLVTKLIMIGGQSIKCRELLNYFKIYMTIFNSDKVPSPPTIFQATSEAILVNAYNEALDQFERNMTLACGSHMPIKLTEEVINLHTRELAAARATFKAKRLLSDQNAIDKKLDMLTAVLKNRKEEYLELNDAKTRQAKTRGLAAYENAIKKVSPGGLEMICVHANDVVKVHNYALESAKKEFDAYHKKPLSGMDTEREQFINELSLKYRFLRLTNTLNNNAVVLELKNEYYQTMMVNCNHDPKPSINELIKEHEKARKSALNMFMNRRNSNDDILKEKYNEDIFKLALENALITQFNFVKQNFQCDE